MTDLLQAFAARKIIHAHGKTWCQLYLVPGDGPTIALAIECDEKGNAVSPSVVHAVLPSLPPEGEQL